MYVDAMYNNVDPIPWLEGVGHPAGGGGGATSFTVGGGGGGGGGWGVITAGQVLAGTRK